MEELAKLPRSLLGDVRLIVIGCAPHTFIKSFRAETGFQLELYCDPERVVYKALGLASRMGAITGHSPHVKSGMLIGTLKSTWRGLKSMRLQGNVTQQGGAFVLGPNDAIHFSHLDANPLDHADINTLLVAAGLPRFDFAKAQVA